MRLFFAINLPEKTKTEIKNFIDTNTDISEIRQLADQKLGRIISDQNWHLTLLFIGDQTEQNKNNIVQNFDQFIHLDNSPEINFDKFEVIAKRDYSMLWLSTTPQTSKSLSEIQKQIAEGLKDISIPNKIDYSFNGHITITRFKRKLVPTQILLHEKAKDLAFKPDKIDLIESQLHSNGAIYTIVKSVPI